MVFSAMRGFKSISEMQSYVGFIPTEIDAKGCMRKIDLIFEKED